MGGFGAFKLAMNCPDKFAAAASLSGALNPRFMLSWDEHRQKEFGWMFGDAKELEGSMNDLKHVLKSQVEANVQLPKLWMHCGTEDFLYEDNIQFRDFVNDLDIDFSYHEGPGQHEWGIWDEQIQHVLRWLPIKA